MKNIIKKAAVFLLFLFTLINLYSLNSYAITTVDYYGSDKWNNTIGSTGSFIPETSEFLPYQDVMIVVLFKDFQINGSQADIVFDIKVQTPDGTVFIDKKNLTGFKGKVAEGQNTVRSNEAFKFFLKPQSPVGDYLIQISATDKFSGAKSSSSKKFTLIKNTDLNVKFTEESFNSWFEQYHLNPDPRKALSAFVYYFSSKDRNDAINYFQMISFFSSVFNDNFFLIPYLIDQFPKMPDNLKTYLLYIFRFTDHNLQSFIDGLDSVYRNRFIDFISFPVSDPYGVLVSPVQLDFLWGEYFARGNYRSIWKLINNMNVVAKIDSSPTMSEIEKRDRKALFDQISATLIFNLSLSPLTAEYAYFIYYYGDLDPFSRVMLGQLISKISQ